MVKKEIVKDYWTNKAMQGGENATIKDLDFVKMETKIVLERLKQFKVKKLLDVGCGNGYMTVEYAKIIDAVTGVDYMAKFIEEAKKRHITDDNIDKLHFQIANALELPFKDNIFDTVIFSRTLINLESLEDQWKAIAEAKRVLKKSGILIMVEVSIQGMKALDNMRTMFNIEPMKKHWHNTYLDKSKLLQYLKTDFKIIEDKNFGIYCLISKIVHSLLVAPEEPKYGAKINSIAAVVGEKIMDFDGSASHQFFLVAKKVT